MLFVLFHIFDYILVYSAAVAVAVAVGRTILLLLCRYKFVLQACLLVEVFSNNLSR